jgi:hypothetical protein
VLAEVQAEGAALGAPRTAPELGSSLAGNRFWLLAGEESEGVSCEGVVGDSDYGMFNNPSRYLDSAAYLDVSKNDHSNRKNRRIRRINQQIQKDMDAYVRSILIRGGWKGVYDGNLPHFPSIDSPTWSKYHNAKIDAALIKKGRSSLDLWIYAKYLVSLMILRETMISKYKKKLG